MGGAFAATADDPSAIFYNVAGIAQQRHTTFLTGGTLINFSNHFIGDPNDAFTSGATGQYKHHTFVPPNAYLIMPIGTNLTVGVGVFTPFGLRTNWEDPWIGRFVSRDANIKTVSVQPSIAWQTTSGNLAIGFGAEYRRAFRHPLDPDADSLQAGQGSGARVRRHGCARHPGLGAEGASGLKGAHHGAVGDQRLGTVLQQILVLPLERRA